MFYNLDRRTTILCIFFIFPVLNRTNSDFKKIYMKIVRNMNFFPHPKWNKYELEFFYFFLSEFVFFLRILHSPLTSYCLVWFMKYYWCLNIMLLFGVVKFSINTWCYCFGLCVSVSGVIHSQCCIWLFMVEGTVFYKYPLWIGKRETTKNVWCML